ncbi:uncharacterized protein LOC104900693 [Beta vulgaris subsp. vulgaris]|uniref:uncharacterized protein LOC104900693 n=1 Tax=Beta vulgaris subsp. vulgaris TaxID=3555 RepID=UPI00203719AD|nr:uncharacterized protein LOC104900693 [Beta vulgaris subsp. vulgaris]
MKAALKKGQEDFRHSQSESSQQTIENLTKELKYVKSSKAGKPLGRGMTPHNPNLYDSSISEDEEEVKINSDQEEEETDPAAKKLALLESYNKKILCMRAKLPGAPTPVATPNGYAQSPFIDEIAKARIPKKINMSQPHMLNDGSTNPYDYVAQYKRKMWTLSIPKHLLEATMCKSFGATLSGPALQWLISLNPGTIPNFAALINKFYLQFASSRILEKHTGDLYPITQKTNEAVRKYLDRFNKEMISVKNLDVPTAIETFRRGLTYKSRLYYELTRYPCNTFEKVRARAMAEIHVEEDDVS